MDPLSITASILTLLGACSATSMIFKEIREIQNVPDILHSLNNEIVDLRLVLLDIHEKREELFAEDFCQLKKAEQRLLDLCHGLLERTWSKVHEAETLIKSCVQRTERNSRSRLDAFVVRREYQRLGRLKAAIREAKEDIQILWGRLDRRNMTQFQFQLNSVLDIGTGIKKQLLEDNPLLFEGHRRIENKLDKLLKMQQILPAPSNNLTANISANLSRTSKSTKRLDVALTRASYMQGSFYGSCQCQYSTHSFRYVQNFLGHLFLGYTATPMFTKHSPDCRHGFQSELVLIQSGIFILLWLYARRIIRRWVYNAD